MTSMSVNNVITECVTCPLENELLDSLSIREVNEVQEAFSDDIIVSTERDTLCAYRGK